MQTSKTRNRLAAANTRAGLLIVTMILTSHWAQADNSALDPTKPRSLQAIRTGQMPVIDGKLDDACWQQSPPISDFVVLNSSIFAEYQSEGHICFDDAHLYIAVKCLLPPGVKPTVEAGSSPRKKHDSYMFSDDIVEIMLDPGHSQTEYYQIAISAYGSTFDGLRRYGGAQLDPTWDGDWTSASHIADGYWSMEIAIPLPNLGITASTPAAWGINLCRSTQKPKGEQSSIAAGGAFNNPQDFAVVEGLDVDFSKVLFQISPGVMALEVTPEGPRAAFSVPVQNTSDAPQKVKIEHWKHGAQGTDSPQSEVVTLQPGESKIVGAEAIELEPLAANRTDLYRVSSVPAIRKVAVSDAASGTKLAVANTPRPWFLEAARIVVDDPWRKDMSAEKTSVIHLAVESRLALHHREEGSLVVQLLDVPGEQVLAEKTVSEYSSNTHLSIPCHEVPWGAYRVRAVFKSAEGRDLLATSAPVTILPGGPHRIRVLNNLVSELMNTRERGLPAEKEIAFMNPREGWVFFSVAGAGSVRLDEETKVLAVARAGEQAAEVMRYLPPGRHDLRTDGPIDQIIVRSIPELIYSCHTSGFEWEYLQEHVLPHCNAILGNTNDARAVKQWTGAAKRWFGFSAAPGHGVGGEVFLTAKKYLEERLSPQPGFSHPLLSGVMVDQISACRPEQKVEIAKMIGMILQNADLAGRQYRPWFEGGVFGSGPDMAFMRLVLDAGWAFAYYGYIPEKDTEQQVRAVIDKSFTSNAIGCNEGVRDSVRRCIASPGFQSYIPYGQNLNVNPATNFKVHMQMQFETFANDPDFFGLYGSFWYYSPYVSEENLRWSAALFRHYGIEGKSTQLTSDPYLLGHIENPDFTAGTTGWNVTEAESGAVKVNAHPGYGGLQGRFISGSRGDTFLVMKRSARAPNAVSQTIKNLTPGRMYSLKMITADLDHIREEKSVDQQSVVSIRIDNVEPSSAAGHTLDVSYPNHYGAILGKFDAKHNAYMTYHWRVFRANGKTARLTISDWASVDDPGGPIGQELMANFIEVEPYFEQCVASKE